MFQIEGRQAEVHFRDQNEMDGIVNYLESRQYSPVFRKMLAAAQKAAFTEETTLDIYTLLGVRRRPEGLRHLGIVGDLLFKGSQAYVLQSRGSRLQAWEIRHHSIPREIETFCNDVQAAATSTLDGRRLRGMNFVWQEMNALATLSTSFDFERADIEDVVEYRRRRRPSSEKLATTAPNYDPSEVPIATLLVSKPLRDFLHRLAKVGKMRSTDATDAQTGANVDIPQLLHLGLLGKEYLVSCKLDSHTICTLQNREEVEETRGERFRCSVCGRPFKEELLQEIFILTEKGKNFVTKSHWMMIWVTQHLIDVGINKDYIAWNAKAGEDELDIMIEMPFYRVFFELKDRDFGLGDAYPFSYRVERYGGNRGIIATTGSIDEEAKNFFKEARQLQFELLEGGENIPAGIKKIMDAISRNVVDEVIAAVLGPVIRGNFIPLVRTWMDKETLRSATPPTS